jgi:HK97 gp10 family phage protein
MSFKVTMPDDLMRKLSRLGSRTDEIVEKALIAGAKPVRDKVKSNLEGVIGKKTKHPSRSTGELVSALGVSPVGIDEDGNLNVKAGFKEPRTGGKTIRYRPREGAKQRIYVRKRTPGLRYEYPLYNALVANVLEYGKSDQLAKPFMKTAVSSSKAASIAAMKKAFSEEVDSL